MSERSGSGSEARAWDEERELRPAASTALLSHESGSGREQFDELRVDQRRESVAWPVALATVGERSDRGPDIALMASRRTSAFDRAVRHRPTGWSPRGQSRNCPGSRL